MPGYVSLKELIDFTKKNYIHNIWNQGISELYNIYPQFKDIFGIVCHCTKIEVSKRKIKENECLLIKMSYSGSYQKELLVGRKNNTFFILSERLNLEEQQKILNRIDFTNLYNTIIENEFFTEEYDLKGWHSPDATITEVDLIYGEDGRLSKIPKIRLNQGSIAIGDTNYQIKYSMNLDKCSISEQCNTIHNWEWEDVYKLKSLFATDPNFIDNVLIEFKNLPPYIQEFLYSNPFENPEEEKQEPKKTGIQKIKQFFKRN